ERDSGNTWDQEWPEPPRKTVFDDDARFGDCSLDTIWVARPRLHRRRARLRRAEFQVRHGAAVPYRRFTDNVSSNFATGSLPSFVGTVAVTRTVASCRSPVAIARPTRSRIALPSSHTKCTSSSARLKNSPLTSLKRNETARFDRVMRLKAIKPPAT